MRLEIFTLLAMVSAGCLLPAILAAVTPEQDPHPAHPAATPGHDHGQVDVHRHGMKHDFSDVAKFEKGFDDPERVKWQKPEHVIELMAIAPGMTVADLGAGTGFFEPPLAGAVGATGKVLALDVEANMVEHLKKRVAEAGLAQVESRLVGDRRPGLSARKRRSHPDRQHLAPHRRPRPLLGEAARGAAAGRLDLGGRLRHDQQQGAAASAQARAARSDRRARRWWSHC